VVFGNHAPPLRTGKEGNPRTLDEFAHLLARPRPENAAAGEKDGFSGSPEQLHRPFDGTAVGAGRGQFIQDRARRHPRLVDLFVEHVARHIQVDGTGLAVPGADHCEMHIFLGSAGLKDSCGPFTDGLEDGELIQFLEVTEIVEGERRGSAECHDGAGVQVDVGDSGEQIERPRPAGSHAHTGLAGDPGVGVGHHRGCLLMADVDEADPKTGQMDRQVEVRPPHDKKHGVDPLLLEAFGNESVSVK